LGRPLLGRRTRSWAGARATKQGSGPWSAGHQPRARVRAVRGDSPRFQSSPHEGRIASRRYPALPPRIRPEGKRGGTACPFRDDLQWLDTDDRLLEHMVTHSEGRPLLLWAYRDNEVGAAHPLRRNVRAIRTPAGGCMRSAWSAPERRCGRLARMRAKCELETRWS